MDGRFCSASSFSLSGACVHPWSRLEPAEQYVLVCEATSPWTDLRPCTFRVSIVGAYLAKVGDRPTFFLFLAIINYLVYFSYYCTSLAVALSPYCAVGCLLCADC